MRVVRACLRNISFSLQLEQQVLIAIWYWFFKHFLSRGIYIEQRDFATLHALYTYLLSTKFWGHVTIARNVRYKWFGETCGSLPNTQYELCMSVYLTFSFYRNLEQQILSGIWYWFFILFLYHKEGIYYLGEALE